MLLGRRILNHSRWFTVLSRDTIDGNFCAPQGVNEKSAPGRCAKARAFLADQSYQLAGAV
jgi:hypothetical protein